MAVMRFLAVLAAFAIAAAARAQDAPRFVGARYDEKARVVRFEAPVGVDWHAAARHFYRRFDPDKPAANDIAHLRQRIWEISGSAEETFRFAPPLSVRRAAYALISAAGVSALEVGAYEGTISFDFDHAQPPNLTGSRASGEAVSRRGAAGGGFVLLLGATALPERIAGARAELAFAGGHPVLTYVEGETRISSVLAVAQAHWYPTIEAAIGFRIAGRRYLFVNWPADVTGDVEGYCQNNYSLYAVGGSALEEVAAVSYNCDV